MVKIKQCNFEIVTYFFKIFFSPANERLDPDAVPFEEERDLCAEGEIFSGAVDDGKDEGLLVMVHIFLLFLRQTLRRVVRGHNRGHDGIQVCRIVTQDHVRIAKIILKFIREIFNIEKIQAKKLQFCKHANYAILTSV